MTSIRTITCQELTEVLTDYLEGVMTPDLLVRFEGHLAPCPGCRTYLEQMRQTIRLTGTLTEETLAPETKDALLGIFRNWNKG